MESEIGFKYMSLWMNYDVYSVDDHWNYYGLELINQSISGDVVGIGHGEYRGYYV